MVKLTDIVLLAGAGIGAYFLINAATKGINDIFKGATDAFSTITEPFNAFGENLNNAFASIGQGTQKATENINVFLTEGATAAHQKYLDESVYQGYGKDFYYSTNKMIEQYGTSDLKMPLIIQPSQTPQQEQEKEQSINETLKFIAGGGLSNNIVNPSINQSNTTAPTAPDSATFSKYFNTEAVNTTNADRWNALVRPEYKVSTPTETKEVVTQTATAPASTGSTGGSTLTATSSNTQETRSNPVTGEPQVFIGSKSTGGVWRNA